MPTYKLFTDYARFIPEHFDYRGGQPMYRDQHFYLVSPELKVVHREGDYLYLKTTNSQFLDLIKLIDNLSLCFFQEQHEPQTTSQGFRQLELFKPSLRLNVNTAEFQLFRVQLDRLGGKVVTKIFDDQGEQVSTDQMIEPGFRCRILVQPQPIVDLSRGVAWRLEQIRLNLPDNYFSTCLIEDCQETITLNDL